MKTKTINFIIIIFLLSGCIGTGSKGIFGTGVSIALDPRSIGTQIDDSIMQKNILARLAVREKSYLLSINTLLLFNNNNNSCEEVSNGSI